MPHLLEHKHLVIRAEVKQPPKCTEKIEAWVKDLIEAIGMKILMGPYATYSYMPGNRGLTVATVIETSHAVLHTWDEVDPGIVMLDVYTCSCLDPKDILPFLDEFVPTKVEYTFLDRKHSLQVLDDATIIYDLA